MTGDPFIQYTRDSLYIKLKILSAYKDVEELQGRLTNYDHFLLLQMMWVQFLTPTGWVSIFQDSKFKLSTALFWLL